MYRIHQLPAIIKVLKVSLSKPNAEFSELGYDSRKIGMPQQTLFFAIKTQRADGHKFIPELIEKGVRNFVVCRNETFSISTKDCNFIFVEDTVSALQALAAFHRQQFHFPVIGITGSNGKTIVKEWLARCLSDDYHIVKTLHSYNSQIGVPLSIWQMSEKDTAGIFEAGISQMGEMDKLETIIHPNIGILTNIGEAHSAHFKNMEEKLKEKLKLFQYSEKLIYCVDNKIIAKEVQNLQYPHLEKISWGFSSHAKYKIESQIKTTKGTIVNFGNMKFFIPFTDEASIENAIHTAVLLAELNYNESAINHQLSRLHALNMRLEMLQAPHNSVVINDTYSLDINSLKISLEVLASREDFIKKTVILSDFEQVIELSKEKYQEINLLLLAHKVDKFLAVGTHFCRNQSIFQVKECKFFTNTDELLDDLQKTDIFRELILVKGARQFHFERVTEMLQLRTHRTVLSLNLPTIIHNVNIFKSYLKPDTKLVAVVKAGCYGMGSRELIQELAYRHIDYFAVAYTDEGIALRKQHISTPILVLGAEAHSFEKMLEYNLEPEIYNLHYLIQLGKILNLYPEKERFSIHIKLDSGMHRLGFDEADIPKLLQVLKNYPKLKVASVFSHLSSADDPKEDDFTKKQIASFIQMSNLLIKELDEPVLRHLLNSAGIVRFPEAQFEMVRLGIGMYGISPLPEVQRFLQNPLTLKTLITQIKNIQQGESVGYNRSFIASSDMKLAVIPIGYADGYPRAFSNGIGKVLVQGQIRPTVGKISMDMTIIDITDLSVDVGDEVIVYGKQLPMLQCAEEIHTIPYELMTNISTRVVREYVQD
jgi:alanine racemase